MRRKPKENNFKAVLETIRHLMNTECVVPPWLHDILLGYGDPAAAHYSNMPNQERKLEFNDTFLDYDHLQASFPGYNLKCEAPEERRDPPYRLIFEDVADEKSSDAEEGDQKEEKTDKQSKSIIVEPYKYEARGPYPSDKPKQ